MANYRWRDDDRRWNESPSGRSGSSWGGWGQGQTGREPYRSEGYESGDYGQRFRGDLDYERAHSGSGYGAGPSWESPFFGYGHDPYGRGLYGHRPPWRNQYGRDWRSQGSGHSGHERSYGGAYGGDWDQDRGWWDRTQDEVRSWMGDDDAERRRRKDEMRQQSHYGRGPRGFTRSDDRIREDVCERLTYDWSVDASEIEVNVNSGEVTLSGTVESRHSKRRTEDIVDDIPGVRHVQNNLRVKESTEGTMGTTAGSATTTGTGTIARPTH